MLIHTVVVMFDTLPKSGCRTTAGLTSKATVLYKKYDISESSQRRIPHKGNLNSIAEQHHERKMWDIKAVAVFLVVSSWLVLKIVLAASRWRTRRQHGVAEGSCVVGFFHPFCSGGGGGERLLWRAVHALSQLSKEDDGRDEHEKQQQVPPLHVLIYTGDIGMNPEEIMAGVTRQFQIPLGKDGAVPVSFVYLRGRGLLDPTRYPVLTMLGQSAGSMLLAMEALFRSTPDVFVDTIGCAFSFPIAWLAGCTVGAYVHYPTISMVSVSSANRCERKQCWVKLVCSLHDEVFERTSFRGQELPGIS